MSDVRELLNRGPSRARRPALAAVPLIATLVLWAPGGEARAQGVDDVERILEQLETYEPPPVTDDDMLQLIDAEGSVVDLYDSQRRLEEAILEERREDERHAAERRDQERDQGRDDERRADERRAEERRLERRRAEERHDRARADAERQRQRDEERRREEERRRR